MANRELQPAEVTQVAIEDGLRDFAEECRASCKGIRRAIDNFSSRHTAVVNARRMLRHPHPGDEGGWAFVGYGMDDNEKEFVKEFQEDLDRLKAQCPVLHGNTAAPGGCQ